MALNIVAEPLVVDEPLYEVVNGQRVELQPMGAYSGSLASILDQLLGPFVRRDRLGRVVVEVLFGLMPIGKKRRPDVAYVSYERWPRNKPVPETDAWDVIPDLAVEVSS